MNAGTLQYDRRDCERTLNALADLQAERAALEMLYAHASDDEQERYGLAIDQCGDAIGTLQSHLTELESEIWIHCGEWR